MHFLYTKNELSEKENKETIPFKIAFKKPKYLEIKLTKEVKYTFTETINYYKMNKNRQKWKDILHSWIKENLLLQCLIFKFQDNCRSKVNCKKLYKEASFIRLCPMIALFKTTVSYNNQDFVIDIVKIKNSSITMRVITVVFPTF